MHEHQAVIDDLREPTRQLRAEIPETWKAFGALHGAAVRDGALSAGTKELIALAIAVVKGCDGCIAYHAQAAARGGARPSEVADAIGVALLMDGGPASVHGPRAFQAYQEFAASAPRTSPPRLHYAAPETGPMASMRQAITTAVMTQA
jgi:AhpD family alkylhydroperoxidase